MLVRERLDLDLVGTASDGEEALEIIRRKQPDMVILDILIPKLSGIQVARTILSEFQKIRILALSSEMDATTVHQVHSMNLPGFVDKNEATVSLLVEAIQEVGNSKRYYSESVKLAIRKLQVDPQAFQKILSDREQEVLIYIGGALSDHEIGTTLGLSDSAIQSHRRSLFRKLDVHSTPELIRFAHENGFWKPSFRKMQLEGNYHLPK